MFMSIILNHCNSYIEVSALLSLNNPLTDREILIKERKLKKKVVMQ